MHYALLVYEPETILEERGTAPAGSYFAAWKAYHKALVEAGVYAGGEPLRGTASATTVRWKGKGAEVQDGPYAETKEQLGGFVLLDVPSLDAALEWAARCPAAAAGAVEVRPLAPELKQQVTE